MKAKKMAFLALIATAVLVLGTRPANAQVAFSGTFVGPHGAVNVRAGHPYRYGSGFGYGHGDNYYGYRHRYARSYYPAYVPRHHYIPRYGFRRFFVAFPFPHYVSRRVCLGSPGRY